MLSFLFGKPKTPAPQPEQAPPRSFFATPDGTDFTSADGGSWRDVLDAQLEAIKSANKLAPLPGAPTGTMDALGDSAQWVTADGMEGIPEELARWFASQGFIGYGLCAVLSQHWLISRACSKIGEDAARNGWAVSSFAGDDLPAEAVKALKRADKKMDLAQHVRQFSFFGRVYGVRHALFLVASDDPNYYKNPFNPKGVSPGSYKGIVQIDPQWIVPVPDWQSSTYPERPGFYEPTYYTIRGKLYHKSHFVVYKNRSLPDIMKPGYLWGGIPVPQLILERVYGAERLACEANALAMSKRTTALKTDTTELISAGGRAMARLKAWLAFRDNHALKLLERGDELQQFDTSLSEMSSLISQAYALVAATAETPVAELLGESPGGLNSTGEHEMRSYRQRQQVEQNKMTPLVERHHQLVALSDGLQIDPSELCIKWEAPDSPTAKELAEIAQIKVNTMAAAVQAQLLTPDQAIAMLAADKLAGWDSIGIGEAASPRELEEAERMAAQAEELARGDGPATTQ